MLMVMDGLEGHAPIHTRTRTRTQSCIVTTTPTIIMITIMICIAINMEANKNLFPFPVIAGTTHALVNMAIIIIIMTTLVMRPNILKTVTAFRALSIMTMIMAITMTTVVMRGSIMVDVMKITTAFRALSIMTLPTAMKLHMFTKSMVITAITISITIWKGFSCMFLLTPWGVLVLLYLPC